jgi:F-type H+-transporting ATPase subunit epsilon
MVSTIQFELVSPESKIMSEGVTMAVIPGSEGDFGVLSGHMPLVANVRTGVVSVYRENMNDVSEKIFIAGGVADVTGHQCTLLAEQAINVNDIDVTDINRQIADIESDLQSITDESDKNRFQKKLNVLHAMRDSVTA